MDHFHRDHDKKEKRLSFPGRIPSPATHSPKMAAHKAAKMDVLIESPPLCFFGSPAQSTGALLSGQLKLNVTDSEVTLQKFEMHLLAVVTTKKPVGKECTDCAMKSSELFKWEFLTEPIHLKKGEHAFPFSYLLPGHLPATTHGNLGTIEYILSAHAATSLSENINLKYQLKVQRAIIPGNEKSSVRIFPPTNLAATVNLPPVIYPIGEFHVEMRLSGIVTKGKDTQTRWRLRKMNWRIDEHSKMVSPACHRHAHKVGGDGKGVLHQNTRTIGGEDLKDGWKTDFDTQGGQIELDFKASIKPSAKPLCDVESPTGLAINHTLVIELIVAEEYCPNKNTRLVTPTGAARVLRMQFTVLVTERSGLGISWDEEQPPMYDDVPASPPGYGRAAIEDYNGEPLPYEELDRMHIHESST
ncbi:hypothetical protein MMC16_005837 [Acarospora aff. strigata]|nr:hypothetical protein [Acarospora aff. strigata]